ncbi:MAG: hypothetical protein M1839_006787 [Geoglossum umbratile]|nr:MAG: hypothetical protein M1839_006787 [Geoglossum umbratile]
MAPIPTVIPVVEEFTHPLQLSAWIPGLFVNAIGVLVTLGQLWLAWPIYKRSPATAPVPLPPDTIHSESLLSAPAALNSDADEGHRTARASTSASEAVLLYAAAEEAPAAAPSALDPVPPAIRRTGAPRIPTPPNFAPIGFQFGRDAEDVINSESAKGDRIGVSALSHPTPEAAGRSGQGRKDRKSE